MVESIDVFVDNYEQCDAASSAFLPNTNFKIYCTNQVTSILAIFQVIFLFWNFTENQKSVLSNIEYLHTENIYAVRFYRNFWQIMSF